MRPSPAGLSASERKAREDEMAAKRQKKEAEKQRILAQAEADRRAQLEPAVPSVPPTPKPPAAPAASGPERNVRLQLRCPQWGRNVIFTSFQSSSTLGDVRRALREDLVQGLAGTGDGRLQDTSQAEAQVPQEESIVLAEQVPPRRKFLTPEDMQITLQAAGLCPSGTLLVDAAPIKVAFSPAPPPEPAATEPAEDDIGVEPQEPAQQYNDDNAGSDGSGDDGGDDGTDDGNDDYGSDDGSDPWSKGKGPKGFGKSFGRGGFGKGTGSGSFGGKWGPGPMFPDDGGQVLGQTPAAPAFPSTGGQSTGATSTPEEQRAAREARLAALERRMDQGQAKEESTRRAEAEKAAAAAAGPTAMPSQETGRIKGQLGTGPNKAERAREREAILKQLEEDRMRYEERHVTASAVQNEVKTSSTSSSACVRLQIRCANSGRTVTLGSSFTPSDSLLAVRDFAAKELDLLPGEGLSGPEMSLAFPPRTVFNELAQLQSSLKDLGLTPSATLLIKGLSVTPAVATEPEAVPPAVPLEAVPPEPERAVGGGDQGAVATCPRGCVMATIPIEEEMWCDRCSKALPIGSEAFNCHDCDYIQCKGCGE